MFGLDFTPNGALYWDNLPAITYPCTWLLRVRAQVVPPLGETYAMGLTVPTTTGSLRQFTFGYNQQTRFLVSTGSTTSSNTIAFGGVRTLTNWNWVGVVWLNGTTAYEIHNTEIRTVFNLIMDVGTMIDMTGMSFTRVGVGARVSAATKGPFDGELAEPMVYNGVITQNELNLLNAGASPFDVRSSDLVFYVPNLTSWLAGVSGAPRNWVGGQPVVLWATSPILGSNPFPSNNFPEF